MSKDTIYTAPSDVVAAALLNAVAMRRGVPPITNVLSFAPSEIVIDAREDALYILEELGSVEAEGDSK